MAQPSPLDCASRRPSFFTSLRPEKRPQLAEAGRFASPRISSTKGARGPTAQATQSHAFNDLLRSRAIAPASGIDLSGLTDRLIRRRIDMAAFRQGRRSEYFGTIGDGLTTGHSAMPDFE